MKNFHGNNHYHKNIPHWTNRMRIKERNQIRLLNALKMNTVCCWGTWALVNNATSLDIEHRATKLRKLGLFSPLGIYRGSCSIGALARDSCNHLASDEVLTIIYSELTMKRLPNILWIISDFVWVQRATSLYTNISSPVPVGRSQQC
jgi:hypothetical protein